MWAGIQMSPSPREKGIADGPTTFGPCDADWTALSGIIAAWADHPKSAPIRMPNFPRGSSPSSVNW
jgi:hypothetical protein